MKFVSAVLLTAAVLGIASCADSKREARSAQGISLGSKRLGKSFDVKVENLTRSKTGKHDTEQKASSPVSLEDGIFYSDDDSHFPMYMRAERSANSYHAGGQVYQTEGPRAYRGLEVVEVPVERSRDQDVVYHDGRNEDQFNERITTERSQEKQDQHREQFNFNFEQPRQFVHSPTHQCVYCIDPTKQFDDRQNSPRFAMYQENVNNNFEKDYRSIGEEENAHFKFHPASHGPNCNNAPVSYVPSVPVPHRQQTPVTYVPVSYPPRSVPFYPPRVTVPPFCYLPRPLQLVHQPMNA